MAVQRTSAAGTIASNSGAPDVSGDITLMAWVRRAGNGAGWESVLSVGDESGSWQSQVTLILSTGNAFYIYHRGTAADNVSDTMANDRWYHCSLYGDFSASGTINAVIYDLDNDTEITLSGTGGTSGIVAEDSVYLGNDPDAEWFQGDFQYMKCWERELTLNEIRTERWSGKPVFLQNLWGVARYLDTNDTDDLSGQGQSFNAGQGSTDGPPVAWDPFGAVPGYLFTAGGPVTIGQPSETDSALAIAVSKALSIGQVTETDSALGFTVLKQRALGLTTETDSALPITPPVPSIGLATETDSALAIAAAKALAIGQPSEADTALGITVAKSRALGQPAETDSPLGMTGAKALAIGQPAETDSALPMTLPGVIILGQPLETDSALAMTVLGGAQLVQKGGGHGAYVPPVRRREPEVPVATFADDALLAAMIVDNLFE